MDVDPKGATTPPAPLPARELVDWTELTLTHRCNQRCFFCYEAEHDRSEPELERVKALVRKTRERSDLLVLCGKEILLRADVLEIIAYGRSLGLKVAVFSNGQALAKASLVSDLAEAGCSSLVVSFHFPDAEVFARAARVPARRYDLVLRGLANVAEHNRGAPLERRIGLSTETDMFALNLGRLQEMRQTLLDAIGDTNWRMRLGRLVPSATHDVGLDHALAPMDARREELKAFVDSQPAELELDFVKTPMCLLPEEVMHRSLDLRYVAEGIHLSYNHDATDELTTDASSTTRLRELDRALDSHPYRWLCRRCSLVSACRFRSVDWGVEHFYPVPEQRPRPMRSPTVAQLASRIRGVPAADAAGIPDAASGKPPYPEEQLLASVARACEASAGVFELVDALVDRAPVLDVVLRAHGQERRVAFRAPARVEGPRSLGCIVDYLELVPAPRGASVAGDEAWRRDFLRLVAGVAFPGIASWSKDHWFNGEVARLYRAAWRRLGEACWPGIGAVAGWRSLELAVEGQGRLALLLEDALGARARVLLSLEPASRAASELVAAEASTGRFRTRVSIEALSGGERPQPESISALRSAL